MINQSDGKINTEKGAIMRVLVSGGTGFVGRHLTQKLVDAGHEVTITSGGTGPHVNGVKKILYRGMDGIDWAEAADQDVIFHQLANNDTRCQDAREMFRINVDDSLKLIARAAEGGMCKKFIYASSTAVYGAEPAPYVEDQTLVNPLNVYGQSKAELDRLICDYAEGMTVIGLRYCNVYGPGEDHKGSRMSMIGQIIRKILKWERPQLFTDGNQKRDWIYVEDAVKMNLLAMNSDESAVYNCGSGLAHSFNEIVDVVNDAVALHTINKPIYRMSPMYIDCPFASEYQDFTLCSIEKARLKLGFEPSFNLKSGIEKYVKKLIFSSC